ncbi:F-box protein At3g07870-like isoform X2 [Durio zibethinus]|uniref:F-box protein At3g07870-like isoform X2 n=1 Tax=Durio zibethinus TaxID=66656 RepID=A0A6P6A6R2_DURZI|nr:F-box protein At3g07870-like isoform X2 [Durio zibethinus]
MRGRKKADMKASSSSREGVLGHQPTANPCKFFQLPRRTIYDILSRLPINTLFHCRCVCKTFLRFISDPDFGRLHLSRSPLCILIKTMPLQNASKRLQLAQVEANGANFQVLKLNFTPKSNLPTCDISYMNACNGLLCLVGAEKDYSFYVCNPILGEFITIQPPYNDRHRGSFLGLGYSAVTNQYKVLFSYYPVIESANRYVMAEIYTIGTGSWRSIGNAPTDTVALPFNAFLNGALHWFPCTPNGSEFIHSFDFDAEQFGTLPPPDHFREDDKKFTNYARIGVLGVVCYNQKRKNLRGTKFFRTRSQFDAIAYTPCFVSLYNVAKGEQISRMQGTRDYDKICTEEFQDCAGCGAPLVNPGYGSAFWVPYGAVNDHVDLYGRNSEIIRCTACHKHQVASEKSFLTLWSL